MYERRRLGRTDAWVAPIALGTWPFGGPQLQDGESVGWSGHDDEDASAAVLRAFEADITHWDTADVYGDGRAESLLGKLWDRIPRTEVFLASKVGCDPGGFDHHYHPDLIRARFERTLRKLNTDWLDLYYLHHCNFGPEDEYFDDAVATVQKLRDDGHIRWLGLSDWDCAKVARFASRMDPDVVQVPRNILQDDYASSGLKTWAEESQAGVAFFGPLMHGLLLGKYSEPPTFGPGDVRDRMGGFKDAGLIQRLAAARQAVHRRFPDHPQPVLLVLTAALLEDSPGGCCIVGQRNRAQADAAATLCDVLSHEDVEWARELYRTQVG